MASENAKIDSNGDKTALAVATNANADIRFLRVDPVTGRLLIDIAIATSTVPVLNGSKIDANSTKTAEAVTDDANLTPRPLLIDNRNGYLWCDVLVEP